MKTTRRFLSLLLVLCMLVSLVPMGVFGEETDETVETVVTQGEVAVSEVSGSTVSTEGDEEEEEFVFLTGSAGVEALNGEPELAAAVDSGLGSTYKEPRDTSNDPVYKILHIDAGRKYTSLATLKTVVDYAAFNGLNQIDLYLSDNQGLRFGVLNDGGKFIVNANDTTYDLTGALGYYDNTAETSKSTDKIDKYLSPAEMKELIVYAAGKGVDIVPSINMPGHMAAILQGSSDARIQAFGKTFGTYTSNESLDMGNVEAVNFALALLQLYCDWFYGITDSSGNHLVKYFSIAADEYGQDLLYNSWGGSGFGTAYLNAKDEYGDLVNFLNRAGNIIKAHGMTPRAFNDAFLSDGNTDAGNLGLNTDYQLYYWGGGWGGMVNATPEELNKAGFEVINSNSNYYYICCQNRPYSNYKDTVAAIEADPFEMKTFATGTVSFEPAGAMYCIWCDHCPGGTAHETDITTNAMEVMAAWAACLSDVSDETFDYVEKTDAGTGVKVGATGLNQLSVTLLDTNPEIAGADANAIRTYSIQMNNAQTDYTGTYRIYLPIPGGWDSGKVQGFIQGSLKARAVAAVPTEDAGGSVKDGYYVLDVDTPYATVGIYQLSAASEGQNVVNISLSVGETYDFGTLTGDYQSYAKDYTKFKIKVTDFVAATEGIPAIGPGTISLSDLVSGNSYLISDGNGNYLSFDLVNSNPTLANSTDATAATKWKVTKNADGTYSFTVTYEQWGSTKTGYLGFDTGGGCQHSTARIQSDAFSWSHNGTGFYRTLNCWESSHDGDWYLAYDGAWKCSYGTVSGATATVSTTGTPAVPGTPAKTTLKLTATIPGVESITIGDTTYNVTVKAPISSATCTEHDITVSGYGVNGLNCAADSSVVGITGYEGVSGIKVSAYSLTPTVDGADYTGEVTVKMPVPSDWVTEGGIIQAFLKQSTGTVVVPVTIENGYATYTVPGGSVSGLFKLPAGYFTKEVNILMGTEGTVTRIQQGAYTTQDVYYGDQQNLVTATAEVTSAYIPAVPAGPISSITAGDKYYITDGNGNYLTIVNGAMANTTDETEAAVWTCLSIDGQTYRLVSNGYNLNNTGDSFAIGTDGGGRWWSPYFDPELGLYKNGRYLVFDGTNWTTSESTTGHSIVYGYGSAAVPAKSTVTFTAGTTTGTTSVVVGTTKYNITVADAALVDNQITIYSMITNNLVNISGSSEVICHVDVNAAMLGITSKDGIDLTTLFPTNAVRLQNDVEDEMVFWKMTWLPAGSHQGTETGSPYLDVYPGGVAGSKSGMMVCEHRVDFTRLRYYNNRWEFYLDADEDAWYTGDSWGVDSNGDGVVEINGWYPVNPTEEDITTLGMHGATAGDGQIVAYYLQVTDVTEEVITNVADWGPPLDNERNKGYGSDYVLLDFATRYEDGIRNPDEIGTFPYSKGSYNADGVKYTTDKTMGFHCKSGWGSVGTVDGVNWRTIHSIMATSGEFDGYEIYMITTTESSDQTTLSSVDMSKNKRTLGEDGTVTGGYDYDTSTETIVWLKDENEKYDPDVYKINLDTVAYGYRENGTHTNGVPYVDSVTIENQHAMLITYYVRYVKEGALKVFYHNRTLGDAVFYNYDIGVAEGTTFNPAFAREDGTEYGLVGADVQNLYSVTQTIEGDPRNLVGVGSFYRSTKLTMVEVKLSEDGTEAHLYYTTNNAKDMVVDFGLPVQITANSMQMTLNPGETVSFIGAIDGTDTLTTDELYVQKGTYGYFYSDRVNNTCYYVPTTVMRGSEAMRMAVLTNQTTDANPHRYVLSIHPATTVYYEQYMADFSEGWSGETTRTVPTAENYGEYLGTYPEGIQQSAYPGMESANNYGYDGIYTGSAKTQATTTATGSSASFSFTGNGFEVYTDCEEDTGTAMVLLYGVSGEKETLSKIFLVDTAVKSGGSDLTTYNSSSNNTPIVSVRDLPHGDYKVVVRLTGYTTAKLTFDGFRVFNTMGSSIDSTVYDLDGESQPEYVEVRDAVLAVDLPSKSAVENVEVPNTEDKQSSYVDQIAEDVASQVYDLTGNEGITAVLYTTSSDESQTAAVVGDYLDSGTKNEVYVRPGQILDIILPNAATASKTQIGLKTLTGTAALDSKQIGQTNMYYSASAFLGSDDVTVSIKNNTDAIISVTDLKIPGGIVQNTASTAFSLRASAMNALLWMGYEDEPDITEPDVTEPEPDITSADTYDASAAYVGGDTVVYNGKTYRAKWWTQGENPETAEVWELVSDSEETSGDTTGPAAWDASRVYNSGDQVTYNGKTYQAKWWTQGETPNDAEWSAWKTI